MHRGHVLALMLLTDSFVCSAAPLTDRQQEFAYSSQEMIILAGEDYRAQLAELRGRNRLDTDPGQLDRVRFYFAKLVAQATRMKPAAASWPWEVHVVDSWDVDALAMAGGRLLIGLPFMRKLGLEDDELVMVIAHEIAHALAEHALETASAVKRMKRRSDMTLDQALFEIGFDYGLARRLAPLSRLQEREADEIGLALLARAGFNPYSAIGFFEKLERHEAAARGFVLVDDHDGAASRVRLLTPHLPEANRLFGRSLWVRP